jgi:hypothetical protein
MLRNIDMAVTDTYRELIKRLDDSNDTIRLEITHTFSVFMSRCMPSGTNQCLVYLLLKYPSNDAIINDEPL